MDGQVSARGWIAQEDVPVSREGRRLRVGSAPGSLTVEPVTRSEGELDPFLRLRGVTKSYDGDTLAVEQYENAETMYGSPASAFVARFVGPVNVFEGEFRPGSGGTAVFRCAGFEVVTNSEVHEAIDGAYSIPPFAIQLSDSLDRPHADNVLPGVVMTTAYVGGSYSVLVQSGNAMFECAVPSRGEVADVPREGTDVWLCWGKREGYAVTN